MISMEIRGNLNIVTYVRSGFLMNIAQSSTIGKCQSRCCDGCAAPKRDAPAALHLPENSTPDLSRACYRCLSYLHIFSWFGENHSRSGPFLQRPFFHALIKNYQTTPDPLYYWDGVPGEAAGACRRFIFLLPEQYGKEKYG